MTEVEELKMQLKEIQDRFRDWKSLQEYRDDYKALAYQQMDCIMTLRKQLDERDKQCADLWRKLEEVSK